MNETELIKEIIFELWTPSFDEGSRQRCLNLIFNLGLAQEILKVEKEITPDLSKIKIVKQGQRVSIVKDDQYYYLVNNSVNDLNLFDPQTELEDIEEDFNEMENSDPKS